MGKYKESREKYLQRKANSAPRPYRTVLPISESCCTVRGYNYDYQTLANILIDLEDKDVYSRVKIPVYMNNSELRGDPSKKGVTEIGYVRGMEDETDIAITVMAYFVEKFKAIKYPIVEINGVVRDNVMQTITSITVTTSLDLAEPEDDCDDEDVEDFDTAEEEDS